MTTTALDDPSNDDWEEWIEFEWQEWIAQLLKDDPWQGEDND